MVGCFWPFRVCNAKIAKLHFVNNPKRLLPFVRLKRGSTLLIYGYIRPTYSSDVLSRTGAEISQEKPNE